MKILLIGNYIYDRQASMQLFATMVERHLIRLGHDALLIKPEPFFGRLWPFYKGIGKWLGYIDKFILFPPRLCRAICRADVVHVCDHSNAFYVKYFKDISHLVTCHDLLAVRSALGEIRENPTKWGGGQLQKMILSGLRAASHIVCVSQATKDDVLRLTCLGPDDVSVIYHGLNFSYFPMKKEEAKKILKYMEIEPNTPFFLHVGNNSWYKNRLGALNIFRYVLKFEETRQFNLIFAGEGLTREMQRFIVKYRLQDKVFGIPSAEDKGLQALYSAAEALLFPSLYEGFGWPIIEAQACGCPVFTTNRAPMTEVSGDAAVYIDPVKPVEAARTIVESLSNSEKMAKIREAGFSNIKRFSTENMIRQYIKVYEKLTVNR